MIIFILFLSSLASNVAPLALIYQGTGACSAESGDSGASGVGCSDAAAKIAELAGFRYFFVGPDAYRSKKTKEQSDRLFSEASVWIQPGGYSTTAYKAMSHKLRKKIKSFVREGGGYVGFCAGGFMAADWLKIIRAESKVFEYQPIRVGLDYQFLAVDWQGERRMIYFEGGPAFINESSSVEVVARYSDRSIAALRTVYGKGRVFVAGPHPEAPAIWSQEDGLSDPDGEDHDIAIQMILWSAKDNF